MRSFALVFLAALGVTACGGGLGENAASKVLKQPEMPTDTQAKCKITKSREEPLIVEWPDAARGKLESLTHHPGLVAVHYEGCELEVLSRCHVKTGAYGYSPFTRKQSRITMRDEDDLYANMPVGAVRLESKLKSAGELNVQMTIVGRYEAGMSRVTRDDLEGDDCGGATHVVAALTVGSFTFFAGADAAVGASASVMTAGAGGKSGAVREMLSRDGDEASCAKATSLDKMPPEGCGALLQIEVMPIVRALHAEVTPVPVTPAPVEPRPSRACPPGQHREAGFCIDNPQTPPPPQRAYNPPPAYQPPQSAERDNPLRGYFWYGAIGFGITAIGAGVLASSQVAAAKGTCGSAVGLADNACTSDFTDAKSKATTYAIITDVSLGLTAACVVGLFLVPAKVQVGVTPSTTGLVVGASRSF